MTQVITAAAKATVKTVLRRKNPAVVKKNFLSSYEKACFQRAAALKHSAVSGNTEQLYHRGAAGANALFAFGALGHKKYAGCGGIRQTMKKERWAKSVC